MFSTRRVRRSVQQLLRDRAKAHWHERHWQAEGIPPSISDFVFEAFSSCSGLDLSSVQPGDSLSRDLHFRELCPGDWDIELFGRFRRVFQVDLTADCARIEQLDTVADWVRYLAARVAK
jgi:hypothetical protein